MWLFDELTVTDSATVVWVQASGTAGQHRTPCRQLDHRYHIIGVLELHVISHEFDKRTPSASGMLSAWQVISPIDHRERYFNDHPRLKVQRSVRQPGV